jgi:septum site-determining protein MinC
MSKSPSSLPIEIKISTVVAISTILHSADPIAIDAALKQMTGGVSDFFEDEFAVIDVAGIADDAAQVDWPALVALLKNYRLNAVAVRGAPAALHDAIRAHGLFLDDGSSGLRPAERTRRGSPGGRRRRRRAEEAPAAAPLPAAGARPRRSRP